ncbi:hypothetical protein V9L16_25100 [Pseudomonas tolaasii]|uniref:hypothetical protein n=1 Tax=Pseudomonas tolaasii TaxID=29442 RepID=UPI0030CE3E13
MKHCMLSLDLADAANDNRTDFYNVLDADDWVKLAGVDTVWKKSFDDTFLNPSIQRRILTALKEAAEAARVRRVTFAAQIGNNEAQTGQIVKVSGGFEGSFN